MYILSICLFVYFYILHNLQSIRFVIIFFLHHSTPSPRKIKYQVDGKQKYISSVLFLYILLWTFLTCWQYLPN